MLLNKILRYVKTRLIIALVPKRKQGGEKERVRRGEN
jgi:hypothetical protein